MRGGGDAVEAHMRISVAGQRIQNKVFVGIEAAKALYGARSAMPGGLSKRLCMRTRHDMSTGVDIRKEWTDCRRVHSHWQSSCVVRPLQWMEDTMSRFCTAQRACPSKLHFQPCSSVHVQASSRAVAVAPSSW